MRRPFVRAAILSLLLVPSAPSAARAAGPSLSIPIEDHRLANGMRVILAPDPSLSDVTVVVRYHVGGADDPIGKEGLAHVCEHLMFDGSPHVAAGEHVRLLEEAGGSKIEGSVNADKTMFQETFPPGRLPLALWLESDRMGRLGARLERSTVEREWQAADGEVDETHRGSGGAAGTEAAWGEVFPAGHRYHRVGSNRIGLGVFGLEDVRAFLRAWYTPANATLVVAGPFDSGATLTLAEKYFGSLPAPALPTRLAVAADASLREVRLDVAASIQRESVSFAWRAPPLESPGDLALDLAATILSQADGRLQRELVARGIAVGAFAGEQSFEEGSIFRLTAYLVPGTDPEAAVTAVARVVADLGTTLTPAEVDVAHRIRRDALLTAMQSSQKRVFEIDRNAVLEGASYDDIDAEAIKRAVREILAPSRRVVTVVHNVPKSPWYGVVVHREEHGQ